MKNRNRDPYHDYKEALNQLSDSFKSQTLSQNEDEIFRVIAIRWGNKLPELLQRGLNIHRKHDSNGISAEQRERSGTQEKVLDDLAETLREDHPHFATRPMCVKLETKLLLGIARKASKGEKVPVVAAYIFHQLHAALYDEYDLTTNLPDVEKKREGAYEVVADAALDDFVEFLREPSHYGDFLDDEIDRYTRDRHGEARLHARMMDEYVHPEEGILPKTLLIPLDQDR